MSEASKIYEARQQRKEANEEKKIKSRRKEYMS